MSAKGGGGFGNKTQSNAKQRGTREENMIAWAKKKNVSTAALNRKLKSLGGKSVGKTKSPPSAPKKLKSLFSKADKAAMLRDMPTN